MASTTTAIPREMETFLHALYGAHSQISQSEDKFSVYSVPGHGISITTDAYHGCRVTVLNTVKHDKPVVKAALKFLAKEFTETRTCKYIAVDIRLPARASISGILPKCFTVGNPTQDGSNLIKDDRGGVLTYWTWTDRKTECPIPTLGATHIYGASLALIDRQAEKVFLVRPKARPDAWEYAGGGDELGVDRELCDTPFREAQEESGVKKMDAIPKRSATIVAQMELPNRKIARGIHQIWACFADGMSQQAFSPQAEEILDAGWFDFDVVLKAEKIKGLSLSPDVKPSLLAALKGQGLQRTFEDGNRIFYTSTVA